MTKNISYFSIIYLGIFICPILLLIHRLKIPLVKNSILSIFRMVLQLTLVGVYLQYIFKWNNPGVNFIYLMIMIFTATVYIGRSSGIRIKKFFKILLYSFVVIQPPQSVDSVLFSLQHPAHPEKVTLKAT